jgi:hypothetical protein
LAMSLVQERGMETLIHFHYMELCEKKCQREVAILKKSPVDGRRTLARMAMGTKLRFINPARSNSYE